MSGPPARRGRVSPGHAPGNPHMSTSSETPTPFTGPVRTCVGCRERAPRSALVRLVLDTATHVATVDVGRSAPGRGAWLHPSRECLDLALRRRAIPRALRAAGPVDTGPAGEWFDQNARAAQDAPTGNESSKKKAGWKPMGTR
ncbi:YlxR family protein [Georgenia yuyongxinii]|uniref:YlxR family protein n=1 Tax=Georgenia yuyongxinii TaxID=2589797 RepID=A0A552WQP9_9MICO|nr:YlxR family protein [Georgenia yuyongxinii]